MGDLAKAVAEAAARVFRKGLVGRFSDGLQHVHSFKGLATRGAQSRIGRSQVQLFERLGGLCIAHLEIADVLKLVPSKWVGFNWDPHNAMGKEKSYPDGYSVLPKERMLNLQIKGKGVIPDSSEKEDWRGIFAALSNDGYEHKIGLETHLFDGTLITAAHKSMTEILKICSEQ